MPLGCPARPVFAPGHGQVAKSLKKYQFGLPESLKKALLLSPLRRASSPTLARSQRGQMRNLDSVGDRCKPPGRRRDGANPRIPEGGTDANSRVLAGTGADAIFRLRPGPSLAALRWQCRALISTAQRRAPIRAP